MKEPLKEGWVTKGVVIAPYEIEFDGEVRTIDPDMCPPLPVGKKVQVLLFDGRITWKIISKSGDDEEQEDDYFPAWEELFEE